MAQVVLENLYKTFARQGRDKTFARQGRDRSADGVSVLRRINLTVADGEFMVLVGPSGCGKSTLLRLISGLEEVTGGNIRVGDRLVNQLPPKQRDIAMVFQSYALYPHLTVYDNLAFGLRRAQSAERSTPWQQLLFTLSRRLPKGLRYWPPAEKAIYQRVLEIAQILQIEALLQRLPRQLSGGQKQRVALGRAMARSPAVFLMDEPLSNLDAKLRTETRAQIVSLQRKLGTTTIYVTHDQIEAMTMGDRIAVMNQGQIQQVAPPLALYHRPANRFVAAFIGSPPMNFLSVQVQPPLVIVHSAFRLTLPGHWQAVLARYRGQTLTLGVRPEHLRLSAPAPKNLSVTVERVEALGSETYLAVALGDEQLQVRLEAEQIPQLGQTIALSLLPDHIHLFEPETGAAIYP
ncbi:MAG: ATP-binding cassette domain-containing protein [Leptolyngbya sp. SIO4C1]|nr:ATP-binding cassette domain-containing protein [Leptolyngbya sp. SIO4C1]